MHKNYTQMNNFGNLGASLASPGRTPSQQLSFSPPQPFQVMQQPFVQQGPYPTLEYIKANRLKMKDLRVQHRLERNLFLLNDAQANGNYSLATGGQIPEHPYSYLSVSSLAPGARPSSKPSFVNASSADRLFSADALKVRDQLDYKKINSGTKILRAPALPIRVFDTYLRVVGLPKDIGAIYAKYGLRLDVENNIIDYTDFQTIKAEMESSNKGGNDPANGNGKYAAFVRDMVASASTRAKDPKVAGAKLKEEFYSIEEAMKYLTGLGILGQIVKGRRRRIEIVQYSSNGEVVHVRDEKVRARASGRGGLSLRQRYESYVQHNKTAALGEKKYLNITNYSAAGGKGKNATVTRSDKNVISDAIVVNHLANPTGVMEALTALDSTRAAAWMADLKRKFERDYTVANIANVMGHR